MTEEAQVEDATDVGENVIEKLLRVAESMMESIESEGECVSQVGETGAHWDKNQSSGLEPKNMNLTTSDT